MAIKLVVFDIWNTLLYNTIDYRSKIAKFLNLNEKYVKQKFKEWNLSKLSNKKFFNQLTTNKDNLNILFNIISNANQSCVLYEDVIKVLKRLKLAGIKLVLLSNATPSTSHILKEKGIISFFDKIYLSCEYGLTKPNIIFFNMILSDFKLNPEQIVMVGDKEEVDLIPAKKLNIVSVLIDRSNKKKAIIADHKIKNLKELLNLI